MMNLMELMRKYFGENNKYQMVLKYTSEQTLITPADMDMNSKFVRRSRRRLNADEIFYFDGIIQNSNIIYGDESLLDSNPEGYVYRTKSDVKKNDYFLFISTDYELLNVVQKKTYNKMRKERDTQLTMNTLIPPNKDREMSICGFFDDESWWFSASSPLFNGGPGYYYTSQEHINGVRYPWVGQYKAIVYGLNVALKYTDKLDKVYVLYNPEYRNSEGIYKIPMGQWKPYGQDMQEYKRLMLELKDKFAAAGVSILFKKLRPQQMS